MIFDIIFLRRGREIGRTPWDRGLESAKQHAKEQLLVRDVDRVEVRDENGDLQFQLPRTLRRG